MTLNRILLTLVLLTLTSLGVLAFGNPQWKWCYVFQAYIYPGAGKESYVYDNVKFLDVPTWYSGQWISWFPSGNKLADHTIVNGLAHGPAIIWHENGKKAEAGTFNEETPIGVWQYWNMDGKLRSVLNWTTTKDGIETYPCTITIYSPAESIDRRAEFGIKVDD